MEYKREDEGKTFIVPTKDSRSPLGQFMDTGDTTVKFPTKYGMFHSLLNYKTFLIIKLSGLEIEEDCKGALKSLHEVNYGKDVPNLLIKAVKRIPKDKHKEFSKQMSDDLFLAAKCRFLLSERNWLLATSALAPVVSGYFNASDEFVKTFELWHVKAFNWVRDYKLGLKGDKIVTGIGTREPVDKAVKWVEDHAGEFSKYGYILRSGHADGMDIHFERAWSKHDGKQEIFVPELTFNHKHSSHNLIAITDEEVEHAWSILEQTGVCTWRKNLSPFVQRLLARNVMQILGKDFSTPTDCVVYYCKLDKKGKATGGTAYAVNLAEYLGIPTYHIGLAHQRLDCEAYLVRLCE